MKSKAIDIKNAKTRRGKITQLDEILDSQLANLDEEGFIIVNCDDFAERILKKRDRVQKSDSFVRSWAFCHVRQAVYDRFHTKRAIDNPKTSVAANATGEHAEYCPAFIPTIRDGKRELRLLQYDILYLEEVNECIEAEQKEISTKSRTVAALTAWRDQGVKLGVLKPRPAKLNAAD